MEGFLSGSSTPVIRWWPVTESCTKSKVRSGWSLKPVPWLLSSSSPWLPLLGLTPADAPSATGTVAAVAQGTSVVVGSGKPHGTHPRGGGALVTPYSWLSLLFPKHLDKHVKGVEVCTGSPRSCMTDRQGPSWQQNFKKVTSCLGPQVLLAPE